MKYFARVKEREYEVDLGDENGAVSVNGLARQAELVRVSGNLTSFKFDGKSYQLFVSGNSGEYIVSRNGSKYLVRLEDEKTRYIRSLIKLEDKKHGQTEIKAPMPGLIVKCMVQEGEQVQIGQSLCIIETMKMENEIRAASDGVVKKMLTKEGDSVDKDVVLAIIE